MRPPARRPIPLHALALTLALALTACGPAGGGASHSGAPAQPTAAPPAEQPTPGGYTKQDVTSPTVQEAVTEATRLLQERTADPSLSVTKVVSAETQVVAGLNVRLELGLSTKGGSKTATVVLYRDLENHWELTSVEGL